MPVVRSLEAGAGHGEKPMERHRGTKPCSHLIEELQHDGEHIWVGFVHLIEQHHGVGALPQLLGQLPALLVAHVTRRGADELGHLGGEDV